MRRRRWIDVQIRRQIESGAVASESLKRSRAISEAVEWVAVALTYFVVAILAFDRLGIPLTTLVAPATVIGIGLGFGAQQMVGDLLAGFFLFAEHQFAFGDVIRLSMPGQTTGITGTVEELTLRVTKLRTQQGELVVVPNSALRQVTNLSKDWSRAVIDIPVAVTEDLEQVTALLKDVVEGMAGDPAWSELILGDPVVAGVETIDVGYVQLRLIARTLPGRQFEVAREIRLRASIALRRPVSPRPGSGSPAPGATRERGLAGSGRRRRGRSGVGGHRRADHRVDTAGRGAGAPQPVGRSHGRADLAVRADPPVDGPDGGGVPGVRDADATSIPPSGSSTSDSTATTNAGVPGSSSRRPRRRPPPPTRSPPPRSTTRPPGTTTTSTTSTTRPTGTTTTTRATGTTTTTHPGVTTTTSTTSPLGATTTTAPGATTSTTAAP